MGEGIASRIGRVLVVGGGHMGQAICAGLLHTGDVSPDDVTVANPGAEKRLAIENMYDCNTVSAAAAGLPADTVVIAVKPDVVEGVARELAAAGLDGALVVSVAAGVTTGAIERALGGGQRVVRVMPNTPLMCGCGMSAVSGGAFAGASDCALVRDLFSTMGKAIVVPEEQQDIATAVSGSGPAYFELFVETIARSAERLGMGYADARALALQTMRGTAELVDQTDADLGAAIEAVSTPGGTTAAALSAMRERGIEDALDAGVRAAALRSRELGA